MLTYIVLSVLVLIITWVLLQAVYINQTAEIYSLFECRFESRADKISYSLQFFTLALSFIAFDFEIFLLLPFMRLFFQTLSNNLIIISIVSLLTLLLWLEMKFISMSDLW